jgi:hypothetical protein
MRPRCVGRCLFLILWTVPLCAAALPARSAVATFTAVGPRDTLLTLPVNWVVLDSVHV